MRAQLPTRFWIEAALAATSAGTLIATLLSRSWIETTFAIDPDHGSGALEWAITLALTVTTLASALLAAGHVKGLRSAARGVILEDVAAARLPAVGGGQRASR